ncbi:MULTISPECIES: CAP family protein [unclassified Okeania]|uniref:CAP family protein n=1 Tax=Microcoleaceae TaxID=1892252 RepID=UPI0013B6284C|nr:MULTISPECIES: CAP family protein [unclassified Okeania]NES78281.1 SCP-like extracellular [Okeania sp. SIO1H4]NET21621.1 SCP-like extracellular [Okeania sp. SIO1H5]NET94970.1 SCP-like extracellular [Okeania sp. SIO1H2]
MPNIDTEKVLSAHNKWRQEVGTPDLTWSDDLAKFAQEWANKLAKDNSFEHRPDNKYGENIYQGTKKSVEPQEVVDYWASEKKDFKYGTFPDVVKDPQKDWSDVGHYTQIIWKNTKEVGCGVAQSNQHEIWVCNYAPAGNFTGEKPY